MYASDFNCVDSNYTSCHCWVRVSHAVTVTLKDIAFVLQGQTALFHAAQAKQLDSVDVLLSLGAHPTVTDSEASLFWCSLCLAHPLCAHILDGSCCKAALQLSLP